MKCLIKSEPLLNETRICLEANNYTDSMPLVQEIVFRKQPIRTSSQAFAVGIAILISDYCGDFFEVPTLTVGADYVEAIRTILGSQVNVAPSNGQARALATHDWTIFAQQVSWDSSATGNRSISSGSVPLACIDWFGDFVDPVSRSSLNSRIGMYYTNAGLLACPEYVSIAMALIHGGDNVGSIVVPLKTNPVEDRHGRIVAALRKVAIDLRWVVA